MREWDDVRVGRAKVCYLTTLLVAKITFSVYRRW